MLLLKIVQGRDVSELGAGRLDGGGQRTEGDNTGGGLGFGDGECRWLIGGGERDFVAVEAKDGGGGEVLSGSGAAGDRVRCRSAASLLK